MQNEITHVVDTALWVAYYRAKETERCDALFQDPFCQSLGGRPIPMPWTMRVLMDFVPKAKVDKILRTTGYVIFEKGSGRSKAAP